MIPNYPLTAPSPLWGLCRNHPLSLRATQGSVAIRRSRCEGEARACTPKWSSIEKPFCRVGVSARRRGNLTQSVILSPSLTVTLSEAKSLISWLRINSPKNLVEILRTVALRMTASQSVPSLRSGQDFGRFTPSQ